ncbi:DUF2254 domain-containing protein [Ilumatobacter sp.]|uniref:DUF2254 domain-containing protein n=1 Tax=Ilumatobacter sp. TaxID=1967498 RepID=UPI00375122E2
MRLRLSSLMERIRVSLFFVPMVGVLASIVGAFVTIWIDSRLDLEGADLPLGAASTVASARAVLSTIAGATMTFAAIAFSISLLIIQQASSQFSPRVVHTLFRDPFNKRVMGLVMGTFTYCLVVLRSVRSPGESGGDVVIPSLSVAIAVVFGIATILSIAAFLNHSAHSMDVSQILDRVEIEATGHARREWNVAESDQPLPEPVAAPDHPAHIVLFDSAGWVQQIDTGALLACLPEGTTAWVYAYPGRYAIPGIPLCALSAAPEDIKAIEQAILDTISIGNTRTMQQDISFGLRQMADVGLKALSTGINDPTTAQDAIFHSAAVLAELLRRDPPPQELTGETDRRVVLVEQPNGDDLVRLAFGELRRAAATQPTVCIYLLEALHLLREGLDATGLSSRTAVLIEQACLVLAGCEETNMLPADLTDVRRAFDRRFGPAVATGVAES